MKLLLGLILPVLFSCTTKNQIDEIPVFTVKKTGFVHSIQVNGIIEAGKFINYSCPINQYDLTITYMAPEGSIAGKGDTICRLSCIDLETRYLDAVKGAELAKSELEKTKAQQELESKILESEVSSIEASSSISMLDSSRLEFYSTARRKISELNLEKAQIQKNKFQRKIAYMKRINDAVLNKLKLRIQQQESRAKRFQDQLNKLKIVADSSGIVQYANRTWSGEKPKIGLVIWGRSPIMNIIDISTLQVRLSLSETYFKQIQKGHRLDITIDAIDSTVYKGKITMKFPQGIAIKEGSNVKYFEALSTIEPLPKKILPGINVSCQVYLQELKDTITIPLIAVFDHDSSKVVYCKEITKCRRVKIKQGALSDKDIVVINGLKLNDKILLAEPPEAFIRQ